MQTAQKCIFMMILSWSCVYAQELQIVDINDTLSDEAERELFQALVPIHAFHARYLTAEAPLEVKVRAFNDEVLYQKHRKDNAPSISSNAYYSGGDEEVVILLRPGRRQSSLIHLSQHLVLRSYYPDAPVWLKRGLSDILKMCTLRRGRGMST